MSRLIFDLGNLTEAQAQKVSASLNGKTYMDFRVCYGVMASGCPTNISTNYQADQQEVAEMIMHCLASELK